MLLILLSQHSFLPFGFFFSSSPTQTIGLSHFICHSMPIYFIIKTIIMILKTIKICYDYYDI